MNTQQTPLNNKKSDQIALFVTCLVNAYRPSTAFSAINLLKEAGYDVSVPDAQTCCGQPNYNNGDQKSAIATAKMHIEIFTDYDFVVAPSSSCAGMIKNHYPKLFRQDSSWQHKALALSEKTWELTDFLFEQALNQLPVNEAFHDTFTHHDSCSSLREVKVQQQVRAITAHCLPNATLKPLSEPENCCGFGGTFCVKFGAISKQLALNKLKDIAASQTEICTHLDTGCALHLESNNQLLSTNFLHFISFLNDALQLENTSESSDSKK